MLAHCKFLPLIVVRVTVIVKLTIRRRCTGPIALVRWGPGEGPVLRGAGPTPSGARAPRGHSRRASLFAGAGVDGLGRPVGAAAGSEALAVPRRPSQSA